MSLKVTTIKDGVVIDHIPNDDVFKVYNILHLQKQKHPLTMALNLHSKTMPHKGMIKIESKHLSKDELMKIALIAPGVTVNLIANENVVEKLHLVIPNNVVNTLLCNNSKCISNFERNINTSFNISVYKKLHYAKCLYCEKEYLLKELSLHEN